MDRLKLHIKNNRAGEEVFRMTPERWAEAAARNPEVAARVDVTIDWDFDRFDASMASADAFVGWDPKRKGLADIAPNLKLIHIIGAGVEHLAPFDWLPSGVTLTNNRGVHAPKSGEWGAMALLMLNARMPELLESQRRHAWNALFETPIAGKTVAIVGAGEMGGSVAERIRPFGPHIVGVRRGGAPHPAVDEMVGPDRLDEVLGRSDFVLVTLPMTRETKGLIDRRRIGLMKPGAGIVNMGRAPVIDYDALVDALRSGHLRGAILDVFEPEPLPERSPYWDVPNLIATPHISSDDLTAYIPRTLDLLLDNLGRMLDGKPFRNVVRPDLGY
ncbi:MAG: D-2-hydroxyacid dehydrogenase [Alphaproteobacteria bacterium]|nr:D-2-hydroxyacid dehydrogenase [Alphaproteobacteria bacterium]